MRPATRARARKVVPPLSPRPCRRCGVHPARRRARSPGSVLPATSRRIGSAGPRACLRVPVGATNRRRSGHNGQGHCETAVGGVCALGCRLGAVPVGAARAGGSVACARLHARSRADWKRASGDFCSRRMTMRASAGGTRSLTSSRSAGSRVRMACSVSNTLAPRKGCFPASISYIITPSANRSERGSAGSPSPAQAPCTPRSRRPC